MRLASISHDIDDQPTSFGLGETTRFNIDTINGKAFKIMSSTLYQNKQGSIVREIASNAVDAHVQAGKADIPFEIHLPNAFEPWFSVRDFGTGLSDEGIRITYCTLFLSTKDESNDAIGAFGLGSKSPFAYTDSFSIISTFNGTRTIYVASLDGRGHPTISEMSSVPTDECNGVEVKIGVETHDFHRFISETADQLKFFKVKPIIRNNSTFQFPTLPNVFKSFGKLDILDGGRNTYVIQGGVGYPLDLSQISAKLSRDENTFASNVHSRGCRLNFDIGEIEVTPSREGISYEYHTINNIAKVFKDAFALFSDTVKLDVAALPNDLERLKYIQRGGHMVIAVLREAKLYPYFNYTHNDVHFTLSKLIKQVKQKYTLADDTEVEKDISVMPFNIRRFELNSRKSNVGSFTLSSQAVIGINDNVKFVYNDGAVAGIARIRNFINNNRHASIYLFDNNIYADSDDTASNVDSIEKAFNGVKVELLSSLDRPVRERADGATRTGYKIPKCWIAEGSVDNSYTKGYECVYDKLKDLDGGYYIALDDSNHVCMKDQIREAFKFLSSKGKMKKDTYIIRKKDLKFVEASDNWEPLVDFIQAKIDAENARTHVIGNARVALVHALNESTVYSNIIQVFEKLSIENDPVVQKYMKYAKHKFNNAACERGNSLYALFNNVYSNPDIRKLKESFKEKIDATKQALELKYPMIFYAMPNRYTHVAQDEKFMEHARIYVNAVNAKPVDSN